MLFKIKTYNKIHSSGLSIFPTTHYTISEDELEPDAIICRSASLLEATFPSNLKTIARAGVGVNNIPIERCTKEGIVVFNTLGANANAVKELVLAAMIIGARNLTKANKWIDSLDASIGDIEHHTEEHKKQFSGFELKGKTIGVIGLGEIGRLVANMGIDIGLQVIAYDPFLSVESALKLSRKIQIASHLEDIFDKSDFITLHVSYSDSTHHLINRSLLSCAKPDTILLNFSRDKIVDEDAVLSLLEMGKLGQYICDFPSKKNLHHPNIISFPHIGASTQESEENCSLRAALAVKNFLEMGEIYGSVNYPNCSLPPSDDSYCRLLVGNENVANVVAQITHLLGEKNYNIENMINTHKNKIAYNIIDVNKELDEALVREISAIPAVYFARCIKVR